jgi:cation transport regulator ChaB
MFIYLAIKHYKELWRVEDRARSGCLKSVRAEAAIKTAWEQIRKKSALETEDHVPKAEHINPVNLCIIRDIYTRQHNSAQRDTSLLLL